MLQYIDKSALIVEIERRISALKANKSIISMLTGGMFVNELKDLLSFLDTLEVKEVDLEQEFDKCCENYIFDDECEVYTARHFFELGLKAQKGK